MLPPSAKSVRAGEVALSYDAKQFVHTDDMSERMLRPYAAPVRSSEAFTQLALHLSNREIS